MAASLLVYNAYLDELFTMHGVDYRHIMNNSFVEEEVRKDAHGFNPARLEKTIIFHLKQPKTTSSKYMALIIRQLHGLKCLETEFKNDFHEDKYPQFMRDVDAIKSEIEECRKIIVHLDSAHQRYYQFMSTKVPITH